MFALAKGTALSDTNLLLRHLKPAGKKIGVPWISWHTFRRTHATLLQLAGGSAKDAQAQLGHAQITTTLGIYTIPVPAHQRAAVEKLSQLVTNGDEFGLMRKTKSPNPRYYSEFDGGRYRIRTYDFHRVKMALYR